MPYLLAALLIALSVNLLGGAVWKQDGYTQMRIEHDRNKIDIVTTSLKR